MTGNEVKVAEPTGCAVELKARARMGRAGGGEIIARWREKEMRAGEGRGRKKGGQKKVCGHRDRI